MRDYFVPELGGTIEIPDSMSDQEALRHVRTKLLPQLGVKPAELPKTLAGQAAEFGKGFVDAIPRGMLSAGRGIAGFSTASPAQLEAQQRLGLADPRLTGYRDLKNEYDAGMGQALAAAPGYEDSYVRMGGSALGSVVPLLATSAIGGGAPALALAMAQGAGGQGENIDEQRRQGVSVSDDQERLAMTLGAGIGATEMLPLSRLTKPLQSVVMRGIAGQTGRTAAEVAKRGAAGALASMGIQAAEEAAQEGGSQFLNNLVEQQTYNDKRGLGEGVIQSALLGGLVGAGLDGTLGRMARRMEARQLEQAQEPTQYMNFPAPGPAMQENYLDALSQLQFAQQPQSQPVAETPQVPTSTPISFLGVSGTDARIDPAAAIVNAGQVAPRGGKKASTLAEEIFRMEEKARLDAEKALIQDVEEKVQAPVKEEMKAGLSKLTPKQQRDVLESRAAAAKYQTKPSYSMKATPQGTALMGLPIAQVPLRANVRGGLPAAPQGVAPVVAEAGSSTPKALDTQAGAGRVSGVAGRDFGLGAAAAPETVDSSARAASGRASTGQSASVDSESVRGISYTSAQEPKAIGQDLVPPQPQVSAWKQQAAPRLIESRRFADKVGAKDVHIRAIEEIEDMLAGKTVPDAKGSYYKGIIQLSMDANSDPESVIGTLGHEITHSFKDMGLFTDKEWGALKKQVQRDGTLAEIQKHEDYGKLSPEQQVEEAIAHDFERFVVGELKSTGQTAGLFNRAKNFLGRLHSGLKGQGFVTAQDVMDRFNQGDIGRRNRPNGVEISTGARINGNDIVVNTNDERGQVVEAQPTGVGRTQENRDFPKELVNQIGDQSGIEGGETMYSRRPPLSSETPQVSLEENRQGAGIQSLIGQKAKTAEVLRGTAQPQSTTNATDQSRLTQGMAAQSTLTSGRLDLRRADESARTQDAQTRGRLASVREPVGAAQSISPAQLQSTPQDMILSMVSPATGTGRAKSIADMRRESGLSREAFDQAFVDLVKSDRIQSSRGDMKVERMLQDGLIREDEYVRDPNSGRPYLTASREDASPATMVRTSTTEAPSLPVEGSRPQSESLQPDSVASSSGSIVRERVPQPKDTPLYSKPLRSANPQVRNEYDKVFGKVEHPSLMQKIQAVFASKDSRRDAITLTRQELFDGRARIAEGTRLTAKSDRDLMADRSADAAARFADRSSNVFAAALTHGYLKYDKGFVSAQGGKGLLTILDPLVKKNLTEEWALYMAAKRGGKLLAEGRENLMTQPQINSALALAQQHPELQTAEREYNAWNKSIVQLLVDTGRIDQQTADKWTSGTYLPFYRLIEDEMISPRMSRTIAGGKKIEGLKGGTAKINDPLTNIIQNGLALTDIALKNVAAQRAIRDAVQLGWARAAVQGDKGSIVTVYNNGKALKFKVEDRLLYDAMTQSDLPSGPLFDLALGLSRSAAQTLRSLVTKSPTFFVKNGIRDSLDVWAKGGHNMTPILSALDGVRQVVNNSPAYQALERSGVVGGTLLEGGAEGTAQRIQRKLNIASDAQTRWQKFWDSLGEASDKSEAVNRVKIYEDAMKRHGNEAQAAYEALEVMNFSRQGRSALIRLTSAMVPFFNARLQGLDWIGRGLAGHAYGYDASIGGRGKEIQKTMIRRGLFMAGVTMAYAFLQSDNDEWLNASPEERANNWFIPMGNGKGSIRVPIPFELGFIFKTVPEDIMANMMKVDTNKQTVEYIKTGLINQLMQPLVPQAVKPLVENFANYSFFKGREIESASQKRLSPEFRSDDYTSELAKFIGEQTGSSPLKIDNVLKGYTGSGGNMVLQLLDGLMREGKGEPPERAIWQIPGLSSFIQRPDGARQIIDFYESYSKISQIAQDIKQLQQSDPEKAMKRMQDYQKEVALGGIAEDTSRRMTDLRKLRKVVQNDPVMPGADKRKMLDGIRKQEIELTRPVNETIRKVTEQ